MKLLRIITLVIVGGLLAAPVAMAAEGKPRLPVTEETTKQKAMFISNLVTKSQSARLIESKGSEADKATLEKARGMVKDAKAKLDAGDFMAADELINQVLHMVNTTSRGLVDQTDHNLRLKEAYDSRKESIVAIMDAFDRVAKEKQATPDQLKKRDRVFTFMDEGDQLVGQGKIDEAREALDKAYGLATRITKEMREGDTLVRELKFETPKDEFLYEVDRNDSHFFLLDMTLKEKAPHPKYLERIEALKAEAQSLREEAERLSKEGEWDKAIKTMEESTKTLTKAVRMGGNFIPG